MKRKSTYLAILFLVSFLTSFGFNTYIGHLASTKKQAVTGSKDTQLSAAAASGASQDNLVFEENENEQEKDGLDIVFFHIPFLFSLVSVEVTRLQLSAVEPLTEPIHNPIYIAVHNFRI